MESADEPYERNDSMQLFPAAWAPIVTTTVPTGQYNHSISIYPIPPWVATTTPLIEEPSKTVIGLNSRLREPNGISRPSTTYSFAGSAVIDTTLAKPPDLEDDREQNEVRTQLPLQLPDSEISTNHWPNFGTDSSFDEYSGDWTPYVSGFDSDDSVLLQGSRTNDQHSQRPLPSRGFTAVETPQRKLELPDLVAPHSDALNEDADPHLVVAELDRLLEDLGLVFQATTKALQQHSGMRRGSLAVKCIGGLAWAPPLKPDHLNKILTVYKKALPALKAIRLAHRFGMGSQVHITKLPAEMLVVIEDFVIEAQRQGWDPYTHDVVKDFDFFRVEMRAQASLGWRE
ncbi:hypothetical protein LTR22_021887 [Elasticomyces elasticus]|nr:hypothetical protein LTR22_021887 [Elasticomyces elasticus]